MGGGDLPETTSFNVKKGGDSRVLGAYARGNDEGFRKSPDSHEAREKRSKCTLFNSGQEERASSSIRKKNLDL